MGVNGIGEDRFSKGTCGARSPMAYSRHGTSWCSRAVSPAFPLTPYRESILDVWIGIGFLPLRLLQGDRSADSEPGFAPIVGEQSGASMPRAGIAERGYGYPHATLLSGSLVFFLPLQQVLAGRQQGLSPGERRYQSLLSEHGSVGVGIIRRFHDHWISYVHKP